jgi:hypothetical protein
MASPAFRAAAQHLQADFDATNGRQVTGEVLWDRVLNPAPKV